MPLPVEAGVVLLDIAFTGSDPKHGFLTGTRQTLLETFDGGKTWEPRFFDFIEEEGINYRYNSISFAGDEGYIVGKPGAQRAAPACRNSPPVLRVPLCSARLAFSCIQRVADWMQHTRWMQHG